MLAKSKKIPFVAVTAAICCVAALCEQKPAPSGPAGVREFPVTLRQKVEAGATPVGTKVEAELVVATLVDGVVIPRDAVFTGEVVESAAKSATDPSRLALRMDSVHWKKGSATVKVYLTAWYYPLQQAQEQDLSYGPHVEGKAAWNGMGAYPVEQSPATQPFPRSDSQTSPGAVPDSTSTRVSSHRVLIRNVESKRDSDGTIALTSTHSNIKLDKLTTYVLATDELQPPRESPKH